jgi:hypothetical protein
MKHNGGITPYYTTIINSTIDGCKFLNGTLHNPIAEWILKDIGSSFPKELIHPCPYIGHFKLYNISFTPSMGHQFLRRRYQIEARSFNDQDENILTGKFKTEMR